MDQVDQENRISFNLSIGEYYKEWIKFVLLSIVTLGMYFFSGTNKLRKMLTDKLSLGGVNFEYTGSAKELFLGFIIFFILFGLPNYLVYFYSALVNPEFNTGFYFSITSIFLGMNQADIKNALAIDHQLMFYSIMNLYTIVVDFVLPFMSLLLMVRYRAARTKWNGYSSRVEGNLFTYTILWWFSILSILTLNIFAPYFTLKRKKYVWENTFVGDKRFAFDETKAMDLMKVNIITTLLLIPTLGISRFWYWAAVDRYIYSKLKFENIRFVSTVGGWDFAILTLTNVVLFLLSLGLGLPYITKRTMDFYCNTHKVLGDLSNLQVSRDGSNIPTNDYGFYNYSSWNYSYFNFGWI